jgi:hypothetical protein
MLTLLSPLFGIVGSLLPSVVKIFERKQEIQYEMEMNRLRMEAALQNAEIQIAIEDAKADVADAKSVRSYDNNIDGGRFINALKSSIRPVITYVFFALFVAVKIAAAYVMIQQGDSIPVMLNAVWDTDTMALFGTIIAFWFGARVLEKMGYGGMQYGRITFNKEPKKNK